MIKTPTTAELREISNRLKLRVEEGELESYVHYLVHEVIPAFATLNEARDDVTSSLISETSIRDRGHFPSKEENPYGAWAWRCSVKGNSTGLLSGMKVALKDNVALAGVPMTNGTSIMRDYVSKVDAEVARRIIAAGGEIVGKTTCENFCWDGGSSNFLPAARPESPQYRTDGGRIL